MFKFIYSLVLTAAITVVLPMVAVAQKIVVPVTFRVVQPESTQTRVFTFGVHANATDKGDPSLGESEIPTLPTPGSVFMPFTYFYDSVESEELWFFPTDLRKMKVGKFSQDYPMQVTWGGNTLEVYLNNDLPFGVDSIYFLDNYTNPPGQIFGGKVVPGTKLIDNNRSRKQYVMRVWFDASTVGVDDAAVAGTTASDAPIQVYPNPAFNNITLVASDASVDGYVVSDINGMTVLDITCNKQESTIVSVASLPVGIYTIVEKTTAHTPRRAIFLRQQ